MYRNTVVALLLACGVAAAQNVFMNFARYDDTEVWLNRRRYQPLQYAEPRNPDKPDSSVVVVPIQQGTNALAIWIHNAGWTGGLCASLDLNEVGTDDTVRSDSSWRCMDGLHDMDGSLLSMPSYDASDWMAAGDYGPLADDTGGNPKVFFERKGFEAQYLFYDKAHWLWVPKTTYMRKVFTSEAATADLLIRGNGFTYKVYLNGALVGERETVKNIKDTPADIIRDVSLNVGTENVIAFEGVCVDSIHHAFLKAGLVVGPGQTALVTDSSWRYSWDSPEGWNSVGFDDAEWEIPAEMDYIYDGHTDPLTTEAHFIWPASMWFRTTFEAPVVGTLRLARARQRAPAPVRPECFTLLGRRMPGSGSGMIRANGMVITRVKLFENEQVDKVLQFAK